MENKEILARLDAIEADNKALKAENAELRKQSTTPQSDEVVEETRSTPDRVRLTVYGADEKLVVGTKIVPRLDRDGKEIGSDVELTLHGEKKPVVVSYGDLDKPNDFMQLKTKEFMLTNFLDGELTGASRIQRGVIVEDTGTVAERKMTGEDYVETGRKIRQVSKKDIRYYTVIVDGEEVELAENTSGASVPKMIIK